MWNKEVLGLIEDCRSTFKQLKERPDEKNGVVDLNRIDEINVSMNSISSIKMELAKALEHAEEIEAECKKEYDAHMEEIREMMEKRGLKIMTKATGSVIKKVQEGESASQDWTIVGAKKKTKPQSAWSQPLKLEVDNTPKRSSAMSILQRGDTANIPAEWIPGPIKYKIDRVDITDRLYIPNVRVVSELPSVKDIKSSIDVGHLYYSSAADTFFMILEPGNVLIHGNIGEITPPVSSPCRVKDCKYFPCKHDNCLFYHDPFKYPGKTDRRNYINGSWDYTGATAGQKRQGEQSRMIGSLSNLDIDIEIIGEQSLAIYGSQIMHDVLVYLLCKNKSM